ncbi:hypothetical protein [Paenibacillus sacheonensis]|uniref:hypothetical protein n=1 Tax=Paenibacillus sacheonensis TaxID=742054 RepID=UPI001EF9734A|nr:hypothetical protein [Paenibacillus sacheonensis]MBM7567680.1 TetR/AcrR family transcriptional repressor of nem operon [Paenibacillus sacheonensis]
MDQLYRRLVDFKSVIQLSSQSMEEKLVQYCINQSIQFAEYDICPTSSLQTDYELLPESMKRKLQEIGEFEITIIDEIVAEGIVDPAMNTRAMAITILSAIKGALQYNRAMQHNFIPDIMYGINRLLKS